LRDSHEIETLELAILNAVTPVKLMRGNKNVSEADRSIGACRFYEITRYTLKRESITGS